MIVGVPREIKPQENRVSAVPAGVRTLVRRGHTVLVERGAGTGSGIADEEYAAAGAALVDGPEEVWERADLIWKVKEPIAPEYPRLREGQIVYTFLHLAPDRPQTDALLGAGVIGIAYETIETADHRLPVLAPMSEVAGRLSVQAGAHCLERFQGGQGILLGGVPGVPPAKVTVIGGGVVGKNAAWTAVGMGARVTIIDIDLERLRWFDDNFHGRIQTLYSTAHTIEDHVQSCDLVIGAVLTAGARTPTLIPRAMVEGMKPGAALVDVAVDQGGCAETTRPTTHAEPTYRVGDVVHYCVANMPGAVPRTSTFALHNATLPYCLRLADLGWEAALAGDPALARGLNVCRGKVTCEAVAEAHGLPFSPWEREA